MPNALAPFSILLSFAMGLVALDERPAALLAPAASDAALSETLAAAPQGPVVIASKAAGARLFFLHAEVNGTRTRFLVDTGATIMVLRQSDAVRAKVALEGRGQMGTANGQVRVDHASVERLAVGGMVLSDIEAVVTDDRLPYSLIGLDALERMGRIVIDGSSITVG